MKAEEIVISVILIVMVLVVAHFGRRAQVVQPPVGAKPGEGVQRTPTSGPEDVGPGAERGKGAPPADSSGQRRP